MRHIYTDRSRTTLLDRLTWAAAAVLAGIVAIDMAFYGSLTEFDRAAVTNVTSTSASSTRP